MLNNITIRGGLTLVISVFVAFLLTLIGVGYGAAALTSRAVVELCQYRTLGPPLAPCSTRSCGVSSADRRTPRRLALQNSVTVAGRKTPKIALFIPKSP
jgi:hypothetical protein